MTSWATLPALRLALALALGIGLSHLLTPSAAYCVVIAATIAAVACLAVAVSPADRPRLRGLGVVFAWLTVGLVAGVSSRPRLDTLEPASVDCFVVEVVDVAPGEGWRRADAAVVRTRRSGVWRPASGRVRLMLAPEVDVSSLTAGALAIASARLERPTGPLNIGSFDYRGFLAQRGIGLQAFVRPGDLRVLSAGHPPGPISRLRAAIALRLSTGIASEGVSGVARALVLGDRTGLDDDTQGAYRRTGAMHVLAVSGLHTGVIAAILAWLLTPLRRGGRAARAVAVVLLWLGLATYAGLTGFAPSVQRSAVMFGVLFAGRSLRADGNALNSLGLSAVVLLLLEPQLLFALGFQLSYTAVAGIIAFYPSIKRFMRSGHRVLDWGGDLLAVSLAATLATAPLTVYYFHQFPLAFALSGLVAVPLVSLALPLLLGGLSLDVLLELADLEGNWALLPGSYAIEVCNYLLAALADLPGVLVEALWPTGPTTALSLLCVVVAGAYAVRRRPRLAMVSAGLFCAAGLSVSWTTTARRSVRQITTYGLRDAVVTDVIAGGTYCGLTPKPTTPALRRREVWSSRAALGLAPRMDSAAYVMGMAPRAVPSTRSLAYAGGGWRWLVLSEDVPPVLPQGGPDVDFVVVPNARTLNPESLFAAFPASTILLTRAPPPWRAERWVAYGSRTHRLDRQGAYVVAAREASVSPSSDMLIEVLSD